MSGAPEDPRHGRRCPPPDKPESTTEKKKRQARNKKKKLGQRERASGVVVARELEAIRQGYTTHGRAGQFLRNRWRP